MVYQVIWSRNAIQDLQRLRSRIAVDNLFAAETFPEAIVRKTRLLAASPRLGELVKKTDGQEIRELQHGNYRIFYRVVDESNEAEVIALHHAAQQDPLFLN